MTNTCPLCQGEVRFDAAAHGDAVISVVARCGFCAATGTAPLSGVTLTQFNRRPASIETASLILDANHRALKDLRQR